MCTRRGKETERGKMKEWQKAANKDNSIDRTQKKKCTLCNVSVCFWSRIHNRRAKCNARHAIAHCKTSLSTGRWCWYCNRYTHCVVRHLWSDFHFVFRFLLLGEERKYDRFSAFILYLLFVRWLTRVTLTTLNSTEIQSKKESKNIFQYIN